MTNAVICVAYAPWALWQMLREAGVWSWAAPGCLALSAVTNALAYTLTLQQGYGVAALSVVYPVARGSGPVRLAGCAAMVPGVALLAPG